MSHARGMIWSRDGRMREYEAFDRSLDVQISRLRKLLEINPAKPAFIQTVWGMGYVFVPDGRN
jgi:two-component system phosphate regulon response regulator OmpR